MTDTEKLNALADDIAAGFKQEPWRDQPGMGYVEIQMDKADADEYRAMAARIAQLEAERDALAAALGTTKVPLKDCPKCHGSGVIQGRPLTYCTDSPEEIRLAFDMARRKCGCLIDPIKLLAARDARMKTEGALEALRGLPCEVAAEPKLLTTNPMAYWRRRGYNEYRTKVDAAIAALEAEHG